MHSPRSNLGAAREERGELPPPGGGVGAREHGVPEAEQRRAPLEGLVLLDLAQNARGLAARRQRRRPLRHARVQLAGPTPYELKGRSLEALAELVDLQLAPRLLLVLQLAVDGHGVDGEVCGSLPRQAPTRHVVVGGTRHADGGEVLHGLLARPEVGHLPVGEVHHLRWRPRPWFTLSKSA